MFGHGSVFGHGTRASVINASRKCSTMALSKAVTKAFELVLRKLIHEKSYFYSDYKRFWVVENSY